LRALDERLLRAARSRWHGARAERAATLLTRLGEHGGVWLLIGALGHSLDRPRRPRWRAATASVACAYALNGLAKLLVRRRRPRLAGLPPLTRTPTRLSFPSAHATTSFAGARAYSRLGLPRGPLYVLALALSASRVYLGVHYPSDVLAGALLGTAVGRCPGRRGGAGQPRGADPA
jgi:membrane-associated phospholipid phosphatase